MLYKQWKQFCAAMKQLRKSSNKILLIFKDFFNVFFTAQQQPLLNLHFHHFFLQPLSLPIAIHSCNTKLKDSSLLLIQALDIFPPYSNPITMMSMGTQTQPTLKIKQQFYFKLRSLNFIFLVKLNSSRRKVYTIKSFSFVNKIKVLNKREMYVREPSI